MDGWMEVTVGIVGTLIVNETAYDEKRRAVLVLRHFYACHNSKVTEQVVFYSPFPLWPGKNRSTPHERKLERLRRGGGCSL